MAWTATIFTAIASCMLYSSLSQHLTAVLLQKYTVVNELLDVQNPRPDGRKIKGTVIIAGGGGGGLIVSSILTKHFTRVIVIEPEEWVNTEEGTRYERPRVEVVDGLRTPYRKRRRVPQFLSLHLWPSLVSATMRRLFPRWDQGILEDHGTIEPFGSAATYNGLRIPRPDHAYPLGMPDMMFVSRANFEPVLRRNVRNVYPEIEFVSGAVVGLKPDKLGRDRIGSVLYKLNGEDQIRDEDTVLFIDCAGPIHAGLKWLEDAGYGKMTVDDISREHKSPLSSLRQRYNQKMNASTSYWPMPPMIKSGIAPGMPWDGYPYVMFPCPDVCDRMFGIGKLEDGQVAILCAGWGDHVPLPKNLTEIREYAQELKLYAPLPGWIFMFFDELEVYEKDAVFDIMNVIPPCSRVLYSKATNIPPNFLAIGDSCMAVNPVYSQGFAKVCMGGLILDSMLRKLPSTTASLPETFSKDFFAEQDVKVNDSIWDQTKSLDYGWSTTIPVEGETLKEGAFGRWFSHHLALASITDKDVAAARWKVGNFVYPGIFLFHPRILWRVVKSWLSGVIPGSM